MPKNPSLICRSVISESKRVVIVRGREGWDNARLVRRPHYCTLTGIRTPPPPFWLADCTNEAIDLPGNLNNFQISSSFLAYRRLSDLSPTFPPYMPVGHRKLLGDNKPHGVILCHATRFCCLSSIAKNIRVALWIFLRSIPLHIFKSTFLPTIHYILLMFLT